jgi:hypothetical protein
MIANTAFLAALTVFLAASLAGELSYPGPYKAACSAARHVPRRDGDYLFLDLCTACHLFARWVFLRGTGRKLTHVDRDLIASEGHEDLPPQLWSMRG